MKRFCSMCEEFCETICGENVALATRLAGAVVVVRRCCSLGGAGPCTAQESEVRSPRGSTQCHVFMSGV